MEARRWAAGGKIFSAGLQFVGFLPIDLNERVLGRSRTVSPIAHKRVMHGI